MQDYIAVLLFKIIIICILRQQVQVHVMANRLKHTNTKYNTGELLLVLLKRTGTNAQLK